VGSREREDYLELDLQRWSLDREPRWRITWSLTCLAGAWTGSLDGGLLGP